MLSVVMLSVVMLSVIMLSVVMLSVVMLSVVMLSVVMLNVVAPNKHSFGPVKKLFWRQDILSTYCFINICVSTYKRTILPT